MGYTPDKLNPLVQTDIELVGMNGTRVSPEQVLLYSETTDTYWLKGLIFQMTTGILSVDEYVRGYVLQIDEKYKKIRISNRQDDTAEDIERRDKSLREREDILINRYQNIAKMNPHGFLLVLKDEIVLAEAQLESLNPVDKQVQIIRRGSAEAPTRTYKRSS